VPAAASLQQLAEESYRLGRTTVLGVLESQRALRDLMIEYLQALAEFQNALADLERSLVNRSTEGGAVCASGDAVARAPSS